MVGFGEAIKRAFGGWSTWDGRATRAEFWWWALFANLLLAIPYLGIFASFDWSTNADGTVEGSGGGAIAIWLVVFLVGWLALLLPSLAVMVRRLHDTDRSGWWYWISLVPCIGGIWFLVLMVQPSSPGPNRYGAPSTP